MAELMDSGAVLVRIRAALTDAAINVVSKTGELRPPCVQILPPGLDLELTGEGWEVPGSDWPLICWYATGSSEVDTDGEIAFTMAVLTALRKAALPVGCIAGSYVSSAPTPDLIPVSDEPGAAKMFSRRLSLHVDHT